MIKTIEALHTHVQTIICHRLEELWKVSYFFLNKYLYFRRIHIFCWIVSSISASSNTMYHTLTWLTLEQHGFQPCSSITCRFPPPINTVNGHSLPYDFCNNIFCS